MNTVYASAICLLGAICCLILRQHRPEMASVLAVATGVVASVLCLEDIKTGVLILNKLAELAKTGNEYTSAMLRACGITLIAEFAAHICTDAGETALASRIKLAQRLTIIVIALPLIEDIISLSLSFMQY